MDSGLYREMYELEAEYWWHRGKRFLVRRLLRRLYRSSSGRPRLLIPGVGTGYLHAELQASFGVIGVDISAESLAFCRARECENLACTDLEQGLPFRDGSFDALLALDVVEHIEDDGLFLAECLRVLKVGGHLVLSVPAFPFLWSSWDEILHHRRRYRLGGLAAILRSHGFDVTYGNYFNLLAFLPAIATRYYRRLTNAQTSEFFPIPRTANGILTKAFELDIVAALALPFPFGLSCVSVARKPT